MTIRLVDLEPRWFSHGDNPRAGFVFLCPCCRAVWLSCKAVAIPTRDQCRAFIRLGLQATGSGADVVPMKEETTWDIKGDFDNLTATPSIDASRSGHWHGHVTNGEIR